jgi:hypothetical protein
MQFTRIGRLDVVTRISGPHHHFLGIEFSADGGSSTPQLERVGIAGVEAAVEPPGARADLRREVLDAVAEANSRLGTHLTVARIRYCADDPSLPGVYGRLARSLVEHVAQEEMNPGTETSHPDGTLIEMNS